MQKTRAELITGHLSTALKQAMEDTETFYALVSFVRTSGVADLAEDFRRLTAAGADVKFLTGDYLYLTEPDALMRLYELGVDIRLWKSQDQSFHPKAYLFERGDQSEVFVGSSNLSRSGITSGVEWNLRVIDGTFEGADPATTFMELFYSDRTVPVNPVTIEEYREERQKHRVDLGPWSENQEDNEKPGGPSRPVQPTPPTLALPDQSPVPRPAQKEALQALVESREGGFRRGLVVLPTGLGKTYVAAFFAQEFRRILFVAHREEILRQAGQSFRAVMPNRSHGFYTGYEKDTNADIILASVYTLASKRHRERFARNAFDLIVVDEFHHAAARSYTALMSHFHPQYLLGLTATPERTDNKDVYALCDGNLVYQITLPDAISKGWLSPFHYYGVRDPIDYGQIRWRDTHYDESELAHAQTREQYTQAVLTAWQTHHQRRTLLFGSSRIQSRYMAEQFRKSGVSTGYVDGMTPPLERRGAIEALERGDLEVLCSVDLFNEGVDIPSVDTILLARPTESMVVFLQQIGRGLRIAPAKDHCTIIDLVGNYRNADHRLAALGIPSLTALGRHDPTQTISDLPDGCQVSLALEIIDMLKKLQTRSTPRSEMLRLAYMALKSEYGRRPTYIEFHLWSGVDSHWVQQEYGSYIGMLSIMGELDDREQSAYHVNRVWLEGLEKTRMTKSYKMVLLKAMLERGENWSAPINATEAAPFFYNYLHAETYRHVDRDAQPKLRQTFDVRRVSSLIADMPMRHLAESQPECFQRDGETLTVTWTSSSKFEQHLLRQWTEEIVDYRLHHYFFERHPRR